MPSDPTTSRHDLRRLASGCLIQAAAPSSSSAQAEMFPPYWTVLASEACEAATGLGGPPELAEVSISVDQAAKLTLKSAHGRKRAIDFVIELLPFCMNPTPIEAGIERETMEAIGRSTVAIAEAQSAARADPNRTIREALEKHGDEGFTVVANEVFRKTGSSGLGLVAGLQAKGTESEPVSGRESLVYFAHDPQVEAVKIGVSVDPAARVAGFQGSVAFTLLATEPGGVKRERELHRKFKRLRLRGEWFRLTGEGSEDLLEYIGRLSGT